MTDTREFRPSLEIGVTTMSEHDELMNRVTAISGDTQDPKTLRVHFEGTTTDTDRQTLASAPQTAQAIKRLEQKRVEDYRTMSLALGQQIERAESLEEQLADARAEIERLKNAIEFAHSEGFEWPADPLPSEALAAPAPEPAFPRVLPWETEELALDRLRREKACKPTTSEAEACTVRWCKSGLPATRYATDCHDDGAWNVAICQQCFDAFDLGRDGEDLPGPEEAKRLLRAAQQQEPSDAE